MPEDLSNGNYIDPGWIPALKRCLLFLVPGWSIRLRHKRGAASLTDLRAITLGDIILFAAIAETMRWVHPVRTFIGIRWLDALVVALGILAIVETVWAGRKLANAACRAGSDEELARTYSTYFFIRLGLWDLPAFVGLLVLFLGGRMADYLIGAAFTISGLVSFAPRKGSIRRLQETISSQGSSLSVGRTLTEG